MVLLALSSGPLVLASLLGFGPRFQESAKIQRYDHALAETIAEPDLTVRARARVEILYHGGDLPGALREALTGLLDAPSDRVLLRRALELETALRLPDLAETHAEQLTRAVQEDMLDVEARRWWEREASALSQAAREIREHRDSLRSATARARWAASAILGAVLATIIALSRPGAGAKGQPTGH